MDEAQKPFDSVYTGLQIEKAIAAGLELLENPEQVLKNLGAEPAGSAAAVQQNLDAHTGNKNNPHGITAQKIGAQPAFTVLPVTQGGTGVQSIAAIAQSLFPTKKYTMPSESYNFAILGPGWADNGHMDFPTLASLLSAQLGGKLSLQTGTYTGTGSYRNTLTLPVSPKVLIIMAEYDEDEEITPLVAIGPGYYLISESSMSGSVPNACEVSEFGTSVKIYCGRSYRSAFNQNGVVYTWVALC